jgi:zinc D-Ala-D-Ala dipeptidase
MRSTKIYIKLLITICWLTTICYQVTNAQLKCTYPNISSIKVYKDSVKQQPEIALVNLKHYIPNVVIELKYASTDNFLHKRLYKTQQCLVNVKACHALIKVQDSLQKLGLGLKIFDAYRPYKYTCLMWALIHDERYVADPSKGSGHNRGIALDITLVSLQTKQELTMPTSFDNFTDTAHHNFNNISKEKIKNRAILKNIMVWAGFTPLETEWWHYQFNMPNKPPVFNIEADKLPRLF